MFWPVLLVQGRRVRRTADRLPEADGADGRVGVGGEVLRVVVLGDSVAAGVGVGHHRHSLAGRLAERLHDRSGRAVEWTVLARSGADARGVAARARRHPRLRTADVVVVSVGVNDVKDLRSDDGFRQGLQDLFAGLAQEAPRARVFLLGMPPIERLPALPRPLSDLLGARGRRLDRVGAEVSRGFGQVTRLEFTGADVEALGEPFAADGFHPGAELHDLLAAEIALQLTADDLTSWTSREGSAR